MPEIEFQGDWDESQAHAIAAQLRKSLDADAMEPAIPQLEDNPVGLLSKRQKRLIELLRQGGAAAFQAASSDLGKALGSDKMTEHECGPDCDHDWSLYEPLEKAIKRDKDGRMYRLNQNNRWERYDGGHQWEGGSPEDAEFRFITEPGEFGRGVYFDVAANPGGWLRLRLSIDAEPSELITDERFYELESDFTTDLAMMLTHQGVKAVAKTEGDRVTRLMVRNSSDIEVQGAIAGSGRMPEGSDYRYQLVSVRPDDDQLVVDVEVAPRDSGASELTKAAVGDRKRPFSRESGLAGTPTVVIHGAKLDRGLVRSAVDRCKLDGVDFSGVQVNLTGHRPDFVPEWSCAFCLPGDGTVMLLHHEPGAALSRFTKMLTHRLQSAARVGAVGADEALELLHKASQLSPEWWLEMLIKRYVGAVQVARVECLMSEPTPSVWVPYLNVLAYRGLSYWGNRRAIAECQAEDFRVAHDPAGMPNLTTLLWDLAVPSVARMCQQSLLSTLQEHGDRLQDLHKGADRWPMFNGRGLL